VEVIGQVEMDLSITEFAVINYGQQFGNILKPLAMEINI
jgi:hypothetical protein